MKKLLQKRLKNEKGLTLVELLAVIVILGIIAAIAVPAIGGVIQNSKYNAVKADALNAINAANLYFIDDSSATSTSTVTVKQLVDGKYLENKGKLNDGDTISNASPKVFSTGTAKINYTDNKTVSFNATLEQINNDNQKGSDDNTTKKIPK
ncbi:prepilin-type N-terminal cleavage/methylation domain-containing protein [Sporosarcina luteola]|uniref:type II secretion system protein n=1 Tax=Sporosarcina luteola TaxID=582850 RepID=UPI00203E6D01|nr:prepilin-type N-terminal cleavage/methylation domain-containing protein [Sporosarcina luteola]MCM3743483.1 prepilin-type N-terminal cleavage/methylation domain-containing protein [Sporosarcina luteola]